MIQEQNGWWGLECRLPLNEFGKHKVANWLAFYKCNTNCICELMLICVDGYEHTFIRNSVIPAYPKGTRGLPESRLQGRIGLAIPGPGFGNCSCIALPPASLQSTRFPAGMTAFVYKGMGYEVT